MLKITVLGEEFFDDEKQKFVYPEAITLELEHSLVTLSKWEGLHERPFLGPDQKTPEELFDYIRLMVITPDIAPEVLYNLSEENIEAINKYIDSKMSGTTFPETPNARPSREVLSAELIYYWMASLQIPVEFEHWHLNRLFSLIKVFEVKNSKDKKLSPDERAQQIQDMKALNAKRKAELGTRG